MAAEKNLENRVKKFLKDNGCYFIKYWGGGTFTKSGVPDILCCCNGVFVGIELKAPNGKASELQLRHLAEIEKAKGFGWLLYPNQWKSFVMFIYLLKVNKIDCTKEAIEIYKNNKGW